MRSDPRWNILARATSRPSALAVTVLFAALQLAPSLAAQSVPVAGSSGDALTEASHSHEPEVLAQGDVAPTPLGSHPPEAIDEPVEVVVVGRSTPPAASDSEVTAAQLRLRPRRRPGDLVEAAPGLISVQHAGGGKANQYFLRGFDIDHGTDLLLTVDRVPVNMPSHGHGQGYADLNFVIPETLAKISVHKGPYLAAFGDFATAGALEMHLAEQLPEGQVAFSAGRFGVLRGLGIVSERVGERAGVVAAGEVYAQDGPFEHVEGLERLNLLGRVNYELSPSTVASVTWMSYAGSWNASGQIPWREVEAVRLSRFGSVDPTEGGATQRHSASVAVASRFDDVTVDAVLYTIRYDWRLYSNFTFYLDDPINGDQIEQTDARTVLGADIRTSLAHSNAWVDLRSTIGIQSRSDRIANALYHDVERERLSTTASAEIAQTSAGFYVDEQARFFPWLALRAGLRVDRMQADVEDRLDDPTSVGNRDGGTADAMLLSPKGSVILSPLSWLDMFVNFGRGFHSNDARGATRQSDAADLLVPATGYEVGAKVEPLRALTLTLAAYRLDLDSEQVYVGDAGTTEASERSTRFGIEATGLWRLGRLLTADAALTLNRAEYRANEGNAGAIALAPKRTFSGGLAATAPFGTFGALRVRHVGERPATESGSITAEGWTIFSASLGHRQGPFELRLDVENLFDTPWREVQFATESRLRTEATPVKEIHFAPGWPLTARGTLTAYF